MGQGSQSPKTHSFILILELRSLGYELKLLSLVHSKYKVSINTLFIYRKSSVAFMFAIVAMLNKTKLSCDLAQTLSFSSFFLYLML